MRRELQTFDSLGVRFWYDDGIHPASQWSEEIAQAIRNCSLFVAMISPDAAASDNVRNEINFASSERRPVLAIHLRQTDLPPGLELQLNARQAILKWRLEDDAYRRKLEPILSDYATRNSAATQAVVAHPETAHDERRGLQRLTRATIAAAATTAVVLSLAVVALLGRAGEKSVSAVGAGALSGETSTTGVSQSGAGPGHVGTYSPATALEAVFCRNADLGYQVEVPSGMYASRADRVFVDCEGFDFRRMTGRSYVADRFVTAPVLFGSLNETVDALVRDMGNEVVVNRETAVALEPARYVESRSAPRADASDALQRQGFREVDYLIGRGPSVLVADLIVPLSTSTAAYNTQKATFQALVMSLKLTNPTCHDATGDAHCGEFYWTTTPVNHTGSADVTAAPQFPRVGEQVTFRVHVRDPDANSFELSRYSFGDSGPQVAGQAFSGIAGPLRIRDRATAPGPSGPWDPPQPRGGDETFACTHSYSTSGHFTASFSFRSSDVGSDVPAGRDPYGELIEASKSIDVAGTPGGGPAATSSTTTTWPTSSPCVAVPG